MTDRSPLLDEPDVHLSIHLHGLRFDYAACHTAAALFLREWRAHHQDTATIIPGHPVGLPRLPNERLYLHL